MSTFETVLPVWDALKSRFHKTVNGLSEQDLGLQLGAQSIGGMLQHNADVEYMFAEWFFGVKNPKTENPAVTDREALVAYVESANKFVVAAMRRLPEEAWHQSKESPIGASTPLEAVGRMMYHTGIHAGQISLIQKHAER